MEAISKSDQTKAAFKNNEISTKGKNINKYLELTAAERLHKLRESQKSSIPQPPEHILELLKLQSERGKFECLTDVLKCLFMPPDVQFRHDKMFTEWEKATAFAIAAIRQQNEHFDYLCPAHDKAFSWMESNEILFEARELLNAYQFTTMETAQPLRPEQDLSTVPEEDHSGHNSASSPSVSQGPSVYSNYEGTTAEEAVTGMPGSAGPPYDSNQAPFTLSTAQLAQAFQGLHTIEEVRKSTLFMSIGSRHKTALRVSAQIVLRQYCNSVTVRLPLLPTLSAAGGRHECGDGGAQRDWQ